MNINWYNQVRWVDCLKTLCCFFNRLDKKEMNRRAQWRQGRTIERDVVLANKFKYIEKVWEVTTYEMVDSDPMKVMKEIIEKNNSRLYD